MEQKALSKWLKIIIIGVGICGLVGYFLVIPSFGQSLARQYPEFSGRYLPWLIFIWLTAIPCYIALFFGWKIAANIGGDRSSQVDIMAGGWRFDLFLCGQRSASSFGHEPSRRGPGIASGGIRRRSDNRSGRSPFTSCEKSCRSSGRKRSYYIGRASWKAISFST